MEEDAADAAARRRRLAQAREEAALKRRSQARRPPLHTADCRVHGLPRPVKSCAMQPYRNAAAHCARACGSGMRCGVNHVQSLVAL